MHHFQFQKQKDKEGPTGSQTSSEGSSDDCSALPSFDCEDGNPPSIKKVGHVLTWTNVCMKKKSTVGMKLKSSVQKKEQHVLQNVNGALLPGQLTAIMGHSGAGKSSLLNILAGKIKSSRTLSVTHDIQLDGQKVVPSAVNIRRKIAFVAQKDVLLPTVTPREAIRFSARLRLDRDVSDEEVELLTKEILHELRLTRVANSRIAQLSGGEMRRTSLGIELVTRPLIVLLDEVTTGLDSYNAMQVLEVLKKVSLGGASVCFTLHQPNSQMFAAIDHLIQMYRGRCMYQGSVKDIPDYFEQRGYAVPPNYNPADWIITVSEGMSSTDELTKRGFFGNFPDEEMRRNACTSLVKTVSEAAAECDTLPRTTKLLGCGSFTVYCESSPIENRVSMWLEIWLLLQRAWYTILRDRKLLFLRFATIGIGAAIIAIVFSGVGNNVIESMTGFQSHLGAIFFLCMTGTIVTQVVLLEFIDERPVVLREYSTNHYRMSSYTISRLIIDGISVFLQILLFFVILYWSLDLQGRFWYLLFCFYTFSIGGASIAVALGSYTKDTRDAKELIPMVFCK